MAAFPDGLNEQVGYEFAASQQYVAIAVYYDAETLPRLAAAACSLRAAVNRSGASAYSCAATWARSTGLIMTAMVGRDSACGPASARL